MIRYQLVIGVLLAAAFGAPIATPSTIESITGPKPFAFAATVLDQGWNQSITYTDVSITMPLEDYTETGPITGVEGTVYLMSQFGTGTTSADEVAPPVSVSGLTASFAPVLLFSGLTLGPGNYYLVLVPVNGSGFSSMTPEGSSFPVDTLGSGVSDLSNGLAPSLLPVSAFPPATYVSLSLPSNFFVSITGDAAPVPEPGGLPLAVGSIFALAFWRHRSRSRRDHAL